MRYIRSLKGYLLVSLSPIWALVLRLRGLAVGKGFICIGRPGINRTSGSHISLGEKVTLCNTGVANPLAEGGRCRLATVAKGAEIILEDGVGVSSSIVCAAKSVVIGTGTIIGGGSMIFDTDFHQKTAEGSWGTDPKGVSKPVKIGRYCFVGARAIILKGVTVGAHSVIGAGAVVTKDVEAYSIVGGNPASVIGRVPKITSSSSEEGH